MRTLVVLGAGALLLAGCGGPTQTGDLAQPLTRATTTTSAKPPPKCLSADVQGAFGTATADNGTVQVSIVATNTSDHTCTVFGYGGLEMRDGEDKVITLQLTRETKPAAATITLQPGQKAYKKVLWTTAFDDSPEAGQCASGASYANVTLPDDTKTFKATTDHAEDFGFICDGRIRGYAWSATDQTAQG